MNQKERIIRRLPNRVAMFAGWVMGRPMDALDVFTIFSEGSVSEVNADFLSPVWTARVVIVPNIRYYPLLRHWPALAVYVHGNQGHDWGLYERRNVGGVSFVDWKDRHVPLILEKYEHA